MRSGLQLVGNTQQFGLRLRAATTNLAAKQVSNVVRLLCPCFASSFQYTIDFLQRDPRPPDEQSR